MHATDWDDERFTTALVELEGVVIARATYDDRDRWNGWLCPYFTRDTVDRIMDALQVAYVGTGMRAPEHYWDGDTLILTEYDADGEGYEDVMAPVGGLYPLGARGWTWERA